MKKNYFLTAFLTLCVTVVSFGQVFITELADPNDLANARYIELYNSGTATVDLSTWRIDKYTNGSTSVSQSLTLTGSVAAGEFYIIATGPEDTVVFDTWGITPDQWDAGSNNVAGSNGDDNLELYDGTGTLVDQFGVPGEDGTGTTHEFEDGRAERIASVTSGNAVWDVSEWDIDNDGGGGAGAQNTTDSFDPRAWVGTVTTASITISSPGNGATITTATSASISITVANFSVTDDGTGDGHIHWTVQENSDTPVAQSMKYNTNDESIAVTAGNSYTVYMELVDNSHTAISPAVNTTTTFTVAYPCDLVLGDISTTCDALTSGSDTFNGSIAFTGGNTGITYTITADSGTIGGDDPSSVADGTITFTGITEDTDVAVAITGGTGSSCDYARTLYSPVCVAFPVEEFFDYTAGTDLIDSALWQNNSTSTDEIQVVTASLTSPYAAGEMVSPTGNMVSFEGSGSDSYIEFNGTSTGTIYTSFLFTATDISTVTNNNGGYFAILAEAGGSYRARLWLKPDATDDTKFNIGVSAGSSTSNYSSVQHDADSPVFVVMGYDFTSNDISVWINPAATDFEAGTAPTATLTETGGTASNLGRFVLRQDSASETPAMSVDELRISTSWAAATPIGSTAGVGDYHFGDFAAYPNPVRNGKVTITTTDTAEKTIRIYNVLGKQVFFQTVTGATNQLAIENLHTGMYILKVESGEKVATKKLVIR